MSLIQNLVLRQPGAANSMTVSEPESEEPHYYFIGYPSWLFRRYAPGIYHALGRRVSVVVGNSYLNDHSHMTIHGHSVPIITLEEFIARAKNYPIEVIHFFEKSEYFWMISYLESLGNVKVVDFLAKLNDFGLSHTYLPVREEREWWASQTDETIARIHDCFGDDRSRRTLKARISAIKTGDRLSLMDVMVRSDYEYFNRSWPTGSLVPRDDEVYVDVGAAHGDTVDKFIQLTDRKFNSIHAFEPTPDQYRLLERRAVGDSRVRTYRNAVGDVSGKLEFFDNQYNPFGGNALSGDSNCLRIEVDCVRLDDVVKACTLIKMDVEGFETRVLRGAGRLISECRPDLAVTCYHYPQDLIEILDCVESIHIYKHVALRHYSPTLYDSILFFSERQSFD